MVGMNFCDNIIGDTQSLGQAGQENKPEKSTSGNIQATAYKEL